MKKGLRIVLTVIIVIAVLLCGVLGYYSVTEYKPGEIDGLTAYGTQSRELRKGDSFSVMTWNIGYGGLGETEDFFMDGGKAVKPEHVDEVNENMSAVEETILDLNPDVLFLQEVDEDSARSFHVNEKSLIEEITPDYVHAFAYNFVVSFLPYPIPPMGMINSGIQTASRYGVSEAWRYRLPSPFKWPVSTVNLKRCLMLERVPIADSDKELVLINLHLEAYDDGEGKIAQTKMLLDVLNEEYEKGNYVIAGGDFNQSFSNIDISAYPVVSEENWTPGIIEASDFGDNWQLLMDPESPSCRSLDQPYAGRNTDEDFQYYVIDGFIVSDNITVEELKTVNLEFKNSDHNPLTMRVTLN
ncbi:MAG: endonuclease/exonuclease/phosphatase family protein [Lachnospiraceae bacterium]|nr:endonuclease/exonuclease/phosphatase family protein [Lachnospiraceae bacterium]